MSTQAATNQTSGRRIQTSGIVLVRQRPGTANGTAFITLEDETGIANLILWPRVMERFRSVVMRARIIHVKGRIQTADNVTHIIAEVLIDCTKDLSLLSEDFQNDPLKAILARPDEVSRPQTNGRILEKRHSGESHPRDIRIIPPSRDFH
ncbi:OB-fold nucleic acid binding domain-containing protein [Hyphomonas oceanitis]|uniref:OB-fold nucleic acid binding domain-containing protein n=1 Tax=Hyphomonas oceanitis TaxID=81033 RepID=UPI0030018F36